MRPKTGRGMRFSHARHRPLLWAMILLLPVGTALAQRSRDTARLESRRSLSRPAIRGKVLDSLSKRPIPGIDVVLETGGGIRLTQTFTNTDGIFQFPDLKEQAYIVHISLEGFEEFKKDIQIFPGSMGAINEVFFLQRDTRLNPVDAPRGPTVSLAELGVPGKARKVYEKGMKELHLKNRPARSIEYFERAIEIHSEYQSARVQLGFALILEERFELALAALQMAVALNPEDGRALALLASAYEGVGDTERMLGALSETVRVDPDNFGAHTDLARLFLASGNLEAAEMHARAAHELNAGAAGPHLLLFNVVAARNDIVAAEAELREFLEKFPDHPAAQQARRQLEKVEQ